MHLFGQCANMEAVLEVAKEHNLFVVEDNCQGIGADYTFSDGTVKNLELWELLVPQVSFHLKI